ncbi:NADPH-dependent 1-acyl dihydroxyacetone phosphate reductase [Neonectria punicea]|uniref:NADPH-dependent 1-acyl dihydroxyacetone phosphate reductase n=1 Tax=Neonectria punicea TaxID=979145 RepID=A0ABR1HBW9_9HYPO
MAANQKTSVLITGCSPGGIGHALALEFQRRGCFVIATARNTDLIRHMEGPDVSVLELDVTKTSSIAECREKVGALTGGRLDILINNAGRTHTIPALDMDLDDVRATYEVNVFGPMSMTKAFAPLLIPARGLILNISSTSSVVPYLFGAIYSSTKGAINTYSRAARMELRPLGVRVMVAMTGTVRSNIASHFDRALPAGSYYAPVGDVFQRRLTFSQNTATMPTEVYARKIAAQALRGEGWLGGWLGGTPDWYWAGGMADVVWATTLMPRWMSERAVAVFFKMGSMASRLQAAWEKKM